MNTAITKAITNIILFDKNHYESTDKDFSIICDEAKSLFEWAVNLPEVDY